MKRTTIHCPYCGAKATLRPSSVVYGSHDMRGGYLYICDRYPKCDSYVSAHQKSKLPMGTLANGDLRNKRIKAHKALGTLWAKGIMTKQESYLWMQAKLGLDESQAHIGKFGEFMCERLISACTQVLDNHARAA